MVNGIESKAKPMDAAMLSLMYKNAYEFHICAIYYARKDDAVKDLILSAWKLARLSWFYAAKQRMRRLALKC